MGAGHPVGMTVVTDLGAQAGVEALGPKGKVNGGEFCHATFELCRSYVSRSNPGNNLHVSGLNHRVDTRALEAAFAKIGRVCCNALLLCLFTYILF